MTSAIATSSTETAAESGSFKYFCARNEIPSNSYAITWINLIIVKCLRSARGMQEKEHIHCN